MRRHKRLLGALVAFMATLTVMCSVTGLAYADKYDYTVRVFQGNRGKLSEDPVSVKVAKDGSVKLFDFATADTSGSKYVQIGFRKSGTDEVRINGVVNNITEDMDFVVAYGVQGETVAFTLKFLEYGTGKELASPKTYYGRIGDKPVAAYEYIEGYRPLYRTITGTLKENPDENVWTFEYVALQEGETTETSTTTSTTSTNTPGNETVNTETVTEPGDVTTTTRTETVPGTTTTQPGTTTDGGTTVGATTTVPGGTGTTTTTVVPVVTGGNGGGTTTTTTTTAAPSTTGGGDTTAPSAAGGNAAPSNVAADAGTTAAAGVNDGGGAQQSAPATREILDMDNPLAGPGSDTDTTGSGGNVTQAGSRVNPFAVAGIALAAAIALGLYFFFIWKRKKDEENEPEPEE